MPCIAKFAEHQFFEFLNTDGDNQPWFNRWGREMYQPNRYWVERSVTVVAFILTAPPAVEARLSEPSSTKQATDSELQLEAIAALKTANSTISVGFIATTDTSIYQKWSDVPDYSKARGIHGVDIRECGHRRHCSQALFQESWLFLLRTSAGEMEG